MSSFATGAMRNASAPSPAESVLLFGMPRSGTTWIGKTFDSHPQTLYLHEPDSRERIRGVPPVPPAAEYASHAAAVGEYLAQLRATRSAAVLGKLPLFDKAYYPLGYRSYLLAAVFANKAVGRFGCQFGIPDWRATRRTRAPVVVWKSIESLGALPLILDGARGAVAIHILRHPCGYIDSVSRGEASGRFGSRVRASEDYGYLELLLRTEVAAKYRLTAASLRGLSAPERLAWRWVLINEKAWGELQQDPRYRIVEYEALCRAPQREYRALFDFAGLSFDPQTAAFLAASSAGDDADYYSVYKNAEAAANAWRNRIDAGTQAAVMAIIRQSALAPFYSEPE